MLRDRRRYRITTQEYLHIEKNAVGAASSSVYTPPTGRSIHGLRSPAWTGAPPTCSRNAPRRGALLYWLGHHDTDKEVRTSGCDRSRRAATRSDFINELATMLQPLLTTNVVGQRDAARERGQENEIQDADPSRGRHGRKRQPRPHGGSRCLGSLAADPNHTGSCRAGSNVPSHYVAPSPRAPATNAAVGPSPRSARTAPSS